MHRSITLPVDSNVNSPFTPKPISVNLPSSVHGAPISSNRTSPTVRWLSSNQQPIGAYPFPIVNRKSKFSRKSSGSDGTEVCSHATENPPINHRTQVPLRQVRRTVYSRPAQTLNCLFQKPMIEVTSEHQLAPDFQGYLRTSAEGMVKYPSHIHKRAQLNNPIIESEAVTVRGRVNSKEGNRLELTKTLMNHADVLLQEANSLLR
ncbi:hypothetical protein AHF37_10155 [Paragonimus kellicotti]|nr:hypothetical protein AHF37_10155 [Paragonimus kellicotti]